jgi:uncharacterized protein YndB with AHSA1/START domain
MKAALQVTTPNDLQIVMCREFNAPKHLVWRAMMNPEYIRQWLYAPEGWEMTVCEGSDKVGGTFRWEWNGPDGKLALKIWGNNLEIVPNEKVVHTENMEAGGHYLGELIATIELTEKNKQTSLKMTLAFANKEARDGALASGMERGVSIGYDKLDTILANQQ